MKKRITSDGTKGGRLLGKRHKEGGIEAIVVDTNKPVELETGEAIINREAVKIFHKELSEINQSAGSGVAIGPPEKKEKGGEILSQNKETMAIDTENLKEENAESATEGISPEKQSEVESALLNKKIRIESKGVKIGESIISSVTFGLRFASLGFNFKAQSQTLLIPIEEIDKFISDKSWEIEALDLTLVLEEEEPLVEVVTPLKYNSPDYRFYVLDKDNQIHAGWEYPEEAEEYKTAMKHLSLRVVSKRNLPVNPDDNAVWGNKGSTHYEFLERAKRVYEHSMEKFKEKAVLAGLIVPDKKPSDKELVEFYLEFLSQMKDKACELGISENDIHTQAIEALTILKTL